jgi:putative membrane protein
MAMTPAVHQHGIAAWAGRRLRHDLLNWRLFLVRVLTSGLAVVVTVVLLPGLRFDQWGWGEFVLIGLVFGLLNAVLKPLIQFFALRYLIASYGLVVVLINALLLALLSWILGGEIQGRGVLAYLIGGLLVGVIGLLLDTIAGATPPILDRDVPSVAADMAPAPAMMAAASAPRPSGLTPEPVDPMVIAQAAAVLSGAVDADEVADAQPPPVPREDDASEEMPS